MDPATVLLSLPADSRAAVLMRHAEREAIEGISDTVTAALTDAGRKDARALGERLAERGPLRFYHSPVPRCAETAERIAEGALAVGGRAEVLGQITDLGGPYMKDWQRVMGRVMEVGAVRLTQLWFSGELEDDLAYPAASSARQQVQVLLDQLADPDWHGMTINVSHDWNVLLVRHHFLELPVALSGWPGYMEAIAATQTQGVVSLHHAVSSRRLRLPLADL